MQDLDGMAREQWGVLTTEQLRAVYTPRQIHVFVERGQLINLHVGVYRIAGAPDVWQQRVKAALLAVPRSVASFESAARVYALRIPFTGETHVTIAKGRSNGRSSLLVHRADLPSHHVGFVNGFWCTTIERTCVDLAADLRARDLAFAIDEAVIAGKTTFRAIDDVLREVGTKGRKGAAMFRKLLDERLPLADSVDSKITLKVLKAVAQAKLPKPETEHHVSTKLGPYYIDAAWPESKIGAEADGYSVHGASRVRHTKDRRRRNELETLGWKILNFTHDMSIDEIATVLHSNLGRK